MPRQNKLLSAAAKSQQVTNKGHLKKRYANFKTTSMLRQRNLKDIRRQRRAQLHQWRVPWCIDNATNKYLWPESGSRTHQMKVDFICVQKASKIQKSMEKLKY
jgi:hypothetical protein